MLTKKVVVDLPIHWEVSEESIVEALQEKYNLSKDFDNHENFWAFFADFFAKPYPYQERLIDFCEKHNQVIFSKFRNGGFDTVLLYWTFWKCLVGTDQKFEFIAVSKQASDHLVNKLSLATNKYKEQVSQNNKHIIRFHNENYICFNIPNGMAGTKANTLLVSEAAFMPEIKHQERKTILYSTINNRFAWFEQKLLDARKGKNDFQEFKNNYQEKYTDLYAPINPVAWLTEYEQYIVIPPE